MPLSIVVLFSTLSTAIAPGGAYQPRQVAQTPPELKQLATRLFSSTWINPNQTKRDTLPQSPFGTRTLNPGPRQLELARLELARLKESGARVCSIPLLRAPLDYDVDPSMVLKAPSAQDIDPGIALKTPAVCPATKPPAGTRKRR